MLSRHQLVPERSLRTRLHPDQLQLPHAVHRLGPPQPKQKSLLCPDQRDWLPEDQLAQHVCDLENALDRTAFYAPYEPRMMVKLLICG